MAASANMMLIGNDRTLVQSVMPVSILLLHRIYSHSWRHFAKILFRDVASEMKLLLDAAGRLGPALPDQQRAELDLARRKLLETSRSFSTALKKYFKTPE